VGDLEALTCDGALRQRLVRRYGSGIDAWLYALPPDPGELASRRRIEPISRSDPAPCIGGPIYDLIDLRLWRARDPLALAERARHLAPAVGAGADRLFDRCARSPR